MKLFVLLSLVTPPLFAWTILGPSTSGWPTRHLTFFINYSDCSIPQENLNSLLDEAIAVWNHVPTADLTITRHPDGVATTVADISQGTSGQVPLIVCSTQFNDATGAPPDSVPAATIGTQDGPMRSAIIVLNSQAGTAAEISQISPGKLQAMFAHEIGHALGLGHSSQSEALMYFSIRYKPEAILTQDDRDGISYLYPRNEFFYGPMGCANARHPGGGSSLWQLLKRFYSRAKRMGTLIEERTHPRS